MAALAGSLVSGTGGHAAPLALAAGVMVILFQTTSEEVFFRGWLLRALERRIGAIAAGGLSALLFAAFHVLGGARAPMSLGNLLLGGVWFGLLALRSGGLAAPVLAHFGWNASEELIAGLSPNPGTGSFGAIADWDLVGDPLWGGTEDGLNSSIGMACVLIALTLPLLAGSFGRASWGSRLATERSAD
jgi:membrane protease YdiL (CAAX protease family)